MRVSLFCRGDRALKFKDLYGVRALPNNSGTVHKKHKTNPKKHKDSEYFSSLCAFWLPFVLYVAGSRSCWAKLR
jgi:hypothetical protein